MKRKALILVLALQCALLIGMIAQQELRRVRGQSIVLETAPVDPRDLLRGDFVILNYKISTLTNTLFTPPQVTGDNKAGKSVFVVLEQQGPFHEAVQASWERPEPKPGQIVLVGRSLDGWGGQTRVAYGLERYYVQEGTGNPQGKLTAEVIVSRSGQGSLKQVFVNGQPYAEVMRAHQR